MCRSFPSAHSLYQQAVFFAARYLFCSSVNLISASWYCFRNFSNSFAHPNKQFELSVLQLLTVQYYTWYWWVSGLSALPCIHKITQNFSQSICSCIELRGTYSFAWTVQPFCQTQINRCRHIISSDSNKQIQFPKYCSKSRYQAVLGIYLYFLEHKAIIFP